MKNILLIITVICSLLATFAEAQIELRLEPIRHEFLVGENVALKLTITNQTDSTINLTNTPGRPWLYFVIGRRGESAPITPIASPRFPTLRITPGSRRSFQIQTADFYRLGRDGSHWAVATIRMPDGETTYSSNRTQFVLVQGGEVRAFTIQARGQRLKTSLRLAHIGGQDALFGQVMNLDTKRILGACYLGRYINFMKPRVLLDSAQNMHILCQSSPEFFTYAVMNTHGKRSEHKLYKRAGGGTVDIISTGRGILPVGVVPYVKPKPGTENIRRTSESPF